MLLEDTIHVQAGGRARGYPIKVRNGIRRSLPQMIPAHTKAHRYAVIADERVGELYGKELIEGFETAGKEAHLLTFPPGEASKNREEWARLTDTMLQAGFGRDTAVVALGGGVAGDLAGFVAATFMRGVPLVQVPTSLVAMIDSSVGGKTGVDVPEGKNLVGAFHSPRLVVVDPEVAVTLPREERAQGLAEAIKHGAILDPVYLADLEGDIPCVLNGEVGATGRVVVRSIEIKADVVSKDERESGLRKVLNFGHTIGHAVESAAGYALPHGSCVALGMVLEARLGEALGITRAGTSETLERLVKMLGLPTRLPSELDPDVVLAFTRSDKKGRGGRPHYVLLSLPGQVARGVEWAQEAPDRAVLSVLEEARA
ncbi:MAG: 3-dehydroquinate synthase [Longimicrobiales bacterium]